MKLCFSFIVMASLVISPVLSYAQSTSPTELQQQAMSKIAVAKDLIGRAQNILNTNPSKENMQSAIYLYSAESYDLLREDHRRARFQDFQ